MVIEISTVVTAFKGKAAKFTTISFPYDEHVNTVFQSAFPSARWNVPYKQWRVIGGTSFDDAVEFFRQEFPAHTVVARQAVDGKSVTRAYIGGKEVDRSGKPLE